MTKCDHEHFYQTSCPEATGRVVFERKFYVYRNSRIVNKVEVRSYHELTHPVRSSLHKLYKNVY